VNLKLTRRGAADVAVAVPIPTNQPVSMERWRLFLVVSEPGESCLADRIEIPHHSSRMTRAREGRLYFLPVAQERAPGVY
jgi:hypothetical protein